MFFYLISHCVSQRRSGWDPQNVPTRTDGYKKKESFKITSRAKQPFHLQELKTHMGISLSRDRHKKWFARTIQGLTSWSRGTSKVTSRVGGISVSLWSFLNFFKIQYSFSYFMLFYLTHATPTMVCDTISIWLPNKLFSK